MLKKPKKKKMADIWKNAIKEVVLDRYLKGETHRILESEFNLIIKKFNSHPGGCLKRANTRKTRSYIESKWRTVKRYLLKNPLNEPTDSIDEGVSLSTSLEKRRVNEPCSTFGENIALPLVNVPEEESSLAMEKLTDNIDEGVAFSTSLEKRRVNEIFYTFGENVAAQLANLPEEESFPAMAEIQNMLVARKMKTFESNKLNTQQNDPLSQDDEISIIDVKEEM